MGSLDYLRWVMVDLGRRAVDGVRLTRAERDGAKVLHDVWRGALHAEWVPVEFRASDRHVGCLDGGACGRFPISLHFYSMVGIAKEKEKAQRSCTKGHRERIERLPSLAVHSPQISAALDSCRRILHA